MKKIGFLLHLFIFLGIGIYSFAASPKIYAVLVGVAIYKDNAIPSLKYSEKDAKDFYNFLRSPFSGAIPEENISLLVGPNATRSNIIRSMVDVFKRSTKDDMVIFYFSGHGEADEGDNSGYLLSYDATADDAPATAISMEEINNRINKCQAKLKVSYVDACHAGMFKSAGKGTMEADNEIIASSFLKSLSNADDGNVAFLASSARQQSQESDKLGNGVFTYYLLEGLKGAADKEQKDASGYNDGLVTVGEMVTYLTGKIPSVTKYNQKPTIQGVYDDSFPLSILKSNVSILSEIAKRPVKKGISNNSATIKPMETMTPSDETLSPTVTYSPSGVCYGTYSFINQLKEPILLYKMKGWFDAEYPNIIIGPNQTANTPRLWSGFASNLKDCNQTYEFVFSFKTIKDNTSPKYAYIKVSVEAGKKRYYIINEQNLYFSDKESNN